MAVAQTTGTQNGSLASGNMDQHLHNPSCLILSHSHIGTTRRPTGLLERAERWRLMSLFFVHWEPKLGIGTEVSDIALVPLTREGATTMQVNYGVKALGCGPQTMQQPVRVSGLTRVLTRPHPPR